LEKLGVYLTKGSDLKHVFINVHFKMKRKSPVVTKSVSKRKGVQCGTSCALDVAAFGSRSPNAWMGKCPPGGGAGGRLGGRSLACGCIKCVLNKKDLSAVNI